MLKALIKRCKPLPNGSKLLILGGGFSGQHIASLTRGLGTQTLCSRRQIDSPGADVVFNSNSSSPQLPPSEDLKGITHVISSIPPAENGEDPVLKYLYQTLIEINPRWVGYLSTTGVYGDYKGEWAKETDLPQPQQPRSKRRLACEKAWQASGLPVQILRLPGIYGPGRSALESVTSGKNKMVYKPGQVFSRIHVDDIAGATLHIIHKASEGKLPAIINIADDVPTENTEVLRYAAELLGLKLPPTEHFDIASKKMSPMALSFWQENRRISNHLLCKSLGYSLMHPNYQSGLKDCLLEKG